MQNRSLIHAYDHKDGVSTIVGLEISSINPQGNDEPCFSLSLAYTEQMGATAPMTSKFAKYTFSSWWTGDCF